MDKIDIFENFNEINDTYIEEANMKKKTPYKWLSIAAALLIVILPNTNASIASALSELPVVGHFFEVISVRSYDEHTENKDVHIEQPEIEAESIASNHINKSVDDYIESIFQYLEEDGENIKGLEVTYDVILDTDTWFTLKLNRFEVAGSGYEQVMYYHIDKLNDQVVVLGDLFEDTTYQSLIKDKILNQIEKRMEEDENQVYFPEYLEDILPNQNFYFKESNIVIVFDEYEIAPGYMGIVSFEIDPTSIPSYRQK